MFYGNKTGLVHKTPPSYPAGLLVSVAEFKTHGRISVSSEDALIETILEGAQNTVEQKIGRPLASQQFYWYLDCFPCSSSEVLELPKVANSVDDIRYTNRDDATVVLVVGTDYMTSLNTLPQRITAPYLGFWPNDVKEIPECVRVTFTSGLSATHKAMPAVKNAIKMLALHLYDNRVPTDATMTIIDMMLAPHKVW